MMRRDRPRPPRKSAKELARELGPLRPVKVKRRHPADGAPLLIEGQVYAFATGETFHPGWCGTVAGGWDRNPKSLKVVWQSEAGKRRECQNCQTFPLTANP